MQTPILYYYDQDGFFMESKPALRDPLDTQWMIPFNATETKPSKDKKGFVQQFIDDQWSFIENHIGETYYSTETGKTVEITQYGVLPDNLTDIPYPGQFYIWSETDSNWVLDEAAKAESIRLQNNATKKELSLYAESRISLIQDEIDLEMTNDLAGAKAYLRAWKKHRILVYRTDTSIESPKWPRRPDLKE